MYAAAEGPSTAPEEAPDCPELSLRRPLGLRLRTAATVEHAALAAYRAGPLSIRSSATRSRATNSGRGTSARA